MPSLALAYLSGNSFAYSGEARSIFAPPLPASTPRCMAGVSPWLMVSMELAGSGDKDG